jgi:hypothetical protein
MLDGREHLSDQYLIFSSKDAADAAHNQSQLLKFINMLFDRLREMVNINHLLTASVTSPKEKDFLRALSPTCLDAKACQKMNKGVGLDLWRNATRSR